MNLFAYLPQRFAPPLLADEEQRRVAALLHMILLGSLASVSLYLLATPFLASQPWPQIILVTIHFAALSLLYRWMWQGQARRAGIIFVAELWLLTTIFGVYVGGFATPSVGNYLICIVLAGLLAGGRYAVIMAGVSVIARAALYWSDQFGLLATAAFTPAPGLTWLADSLSYGFMALLLWLAARNLRQALGNERQNAQSLEASNLALQASEEFVQSVLNSVASHIAVLNKEGTIIAVNQTWRQFALTNRGLSPDRTGIGENYLDVCRRATGKDAAYALAAADGIQTVLTGEQSRFLLEYPCFGPTEKQWFLLTVTPLVNKAGGAVVSHFDITERRQAEELLQQNEARYRALIEAIPDGIARIGRDGRYLDVVASKTFRPVQPIDQLIGRTIQDVFPAALAEKMLTHYERAILEKRSEIFEFDLLLDGEMHIRESRVVPIGDNEVLIIVRDVTKQKRAEAALHEGEERYRTLVEMSPDAIYINRQNQIVYANPACCRLLGATSAAAILGKSPFDFLHPAGQARAKERIVKLLEEGGFAPVMEQRFIRLDGVVIDVEVTAAAIQDQGETALQVVLHDLTTRKRVEAEKLQLLEEVTEQRTQLRALNRRLGETQEMERKALARELHDQVGQNLSLLAINLKMLQIQCTAIPLADDLVRSRFKDAQSVLQQINERIRNVMVDLWPPVLDDYGLVAALEWYAARVATHSQLVIAVQGAELVPRPAARLEQALFRITQEALTNVVKHAHASRVTISITSDPSTIRLTIMDDGRGFDLSTLEATVNGNGSASGHNWGLLTMRERAHAIGGQLQIRSHPGEGVTISVDVPWAGSPSA